jgi:hypothetical protein
VTVTQAAQAAARTEVALTRLALAAAARPARARELRKLLSRIPGEFVQTAGPGGRSGRLAAAGLAAGTMRALHLWCLLIAAGCTPRPAPVAAARQADVPPRVGVLVQGPAVKGLFRDAECLVWALARDPVRLNGRAPAALSVFYTANYAMLDSVVGAGMQCVEDRARGKFCATADALGPGDSSIFERHMVAAGTDVREWLKTLDVVVVFESVLRSFFATAHKLGVRKKVLVLNIDWTEPNALLALHSEISGLQLWTKGPATQKAIEALLLEHLTRHNVGTPAAIVAASVKLVPWSIPDAVVRQDSRVAYFSGTRPAAASAAPPASALAAIYGGEPPPRRRRQLLQQQQQPQQQLPGGRGPEAVRFLFIAGMGGIRNRCFPGARNPLMSHLPRQSGLCSRAAPASSTPSPIT